MDIKSWIKIGLVTALLFIPYLFGTVNQVKEEVYQKEQNRRLESLKRSVNRVKQDLQDGKAYELCQTLAAWRETHEIESFGVFGESVNCHYPESLIATIIPNDKLLGYKVGGISYFGFASKHSGHSWQVSVFDIPPPGTIAFLLKHPEMIGGVVQDFSYSFGFVAILFVVLVLLKSEIILRKFRQSEKNSKFWSMVDSLANLFSIESTKRISNAVTSTIDHSKKLECEIDLLETSLEHSILEDIRKTAGKVPYTFEGVVARVDINGYTKLVQKGIANAAQTLTTQFTKLVSKNISKYNGRLEKMIGDEAVVVFRDADAAYQACAFARDTMNELTAMKFNFDGIEQFFSKTSLYLSPIKLDVNEAGFYFDGSALTVTQRILKCVEEAEKGQNTLSFLKPNIASLSPIVVEPKEMRSFDLRDLDRSDGHLITEFQKIDSIYDQQPKYLKYFRSDADSAFLLKKIVTETDPIKIEAICETICLTINKECSDLLVEAWVSSLKNIEVRALKDPSIIMAFTKIIVFGSSLIPESKWSPTCTTAALSIDKSIDNRINASVIDLLIKRDISAIEVENERQFIKPGDKSFRVQGNLLVLEANQNLSDEVLKKLIKMLRSKNSLEFSTGVFASCRVILDYREKNPAALNTFSSYTKVLSLLGMAKNRSELSDRIRGFLNLVIG